MPDILIRGMEMPKSCADCHDADLPTAIAWLGAKCPCAYGMNKQGVHDLRNKRHPDCPLHELPPHGDLIDLSELQKFPIRLDHYDKEHGDEHFVYGIESLMEYAECLPVIVPAERRDADA